VGLLELGSKGKEETDGYTRRPDTEALRKSIYGSHIRIGSPDRRGAGMHFEPHCLQCVRFSSTGGGQRLTHDPTTREEEGKSVGIETEQDTLRKPHAGV